MFKVIQCRHCGWIQVTRAEKRLKCRKCNRTSSVKSSKVFFKDRNSLKAAEACKRIKEEKKR